MTDNKTEQNIQKRGRVIIITPPRYMLESLYLASVSENAVYETFVKHSENYNELFNFILDSYPNYLAVKITFEKFKSQMETLSRLKQKLPLTKIIVFGEPFLTYNNNVTYENPFIDYVIMGEAEQTFKEILDGYQESEILGICYTDENMQSVKNEQRPYIENLDKLPYPARQFLTDNKLVELEVSRGCPYHCIFCLSTAKNGVAHRFRTPESIIKEMKLCIENYKTKRFYFKADIFNFDNNWIEKLCNLIIENKLNIKWSCDLVPKNITEELVKLMCKSGLRYCKIGAESGSKEILKNLNKDITVESIKETVMCLKKYKVKTCVYYVLGLPWETEETAKETIKFSQELDSDEAVFNSAIPYPATKLFVYSMLNKLFIPSNEFCGQSRLPLCKTHKLSKNRVFELCNSASKHFNKRPKKLLKEFVNFCNKLFIN